MNELDVQIVQLQQTQVASFSGFSESPESVAWGKLIAWAKPQGFLNNSETHPIFGFNNPNPSVGSPNYGYELWVVIEPEQLADDDLTIKTFEGGSYAVTRCAVPQGQFEVIGVTWQKLVRWLEDSKYQHGTHQWLEKTVPTDQPGLEFVLDLYLPITM